MDVTCRTLSDSTNSPFSSSSPSSSSLKSISASGGSLLDVGVSSHERPSEDLLFLNDLRNLSTKRMWNLFKLLWLSVDAGFGGLLPALALLGLVTSEVCEVRDELRENCGLVARCDMYIGWLRCRDGEPAINSLPGDVDKLGHSDREPSDTFRERQELLFEHSETRRWRPLYMSNSFFITGIIKAMFSLWIFRTRYDQIVKLYYDYRLLRCTQMRLHLLPKDTGNVRRLSYPSRFTQKKKSIVFPSVYV